VRAFSHKFSIAPAAKLLIIKKWEKKSDALQQHDKFGGIVRRTPALDKKCDVCGFIGRPVCRAACRYFGYSVVQKRFFCLAGATRCTDKCEILHGEADQFSTFYLHRNIEAQHLNRQHLEFCPPLRIDAVHLFVRTIASTPVDTLPFPILRRWSPLT